MWTSDLTHCCGRQPEFYSRDATDGSEPWIVKCLVCKRKVSRQHAQYAIREWNTEMKEPEKYIEERLASKGW